MTVRVKMTLQEAQMIGQSKLSMDDRLFTKCFQAAKEMPDMKPEHLPPMTLALGIMGYAKAHAEPEKIASELTDALALVAKAEREWRMEQVVGRGRG